MENEPISMLNVEANENDNRMKILYSGCKGNVLFFKAEDYYLYFF